LLNKGIYNEAFENFSYSSYFAHAADNHWRYYHSLLYLNLFSGFEHQDVMDMENKIMAIDSTQYYASSYFIMALIAARESLNKAQEYLDKALNYAHTIGNELVCVLAKYFLGIIDNNQMNDTLPSDIQKYGKGLTSLIKGLISNSTDSPMNPKCLLPFYKYQEIEGERINLVYLAENDVHDIFDYASLDLPTRFVMWTKHKTVNDTIAYIHQTREMEKKGILYVWGIRTKSNNQIIGTIELNYNLKEDAAEFGIIISNKFWMSGYATESLKLIIDFCKSKLKLCRIIGICFTVNQRSSKLMKNNGFIFEKTIPDYHDKSNIPDKSGALYSLILINE
jgi:RimJ/RimL family protein N-acetyltransferase